MFSSINNNKFKCRFECGDAVHISDGGGHSSCQPRRGGGFGGEVELGVIQAAMEVDSVFAKNILWLLSSVC